MQSCYTGQRFGVPGGEGIQGGEGTTGGYVSADGTYRKCLSNSQE